MSEQSALKKLLQENKNERFIFVKPGGNHGDTLIYFGLELLAKVLGLQYQSLTMNDFLSYQIDPNCIVYLHGGGGFNRWCSGASLKILKHAVNSDAKAVIQGPCTVETDSDYIECILLEEINTRRCGKLYFFARELETYRLCQESDLNIKARVLLDKDTAFWSDKSALESLAGRPQNRYRLYALREDNEGSDQVIHQFGKGVQLDPAYFCKSFEHWVRLHLYAKEIVTNRTHSSIIGALLGKHVVFYPGRYHKNRSIWEYSLKRYGVVWGPDQRHPIDNTKTFWGYLPRKIRNSYKVKQLARWLHRVPLQ